ncbi:MAG TPA: DUF3516 domain-containing protein, partial [Holophaga sp.]|nr:DUF3516 domain-containing protein [Holophaga sp.]
DRNFVNWDEQTFQRLIAASPERLQSRFQVSHGMLLNVLSRRGDSCAAMRELVRDSHETTRAKELHVRRGWQLFRSLLGRKIVEFHEGGLRVNVELQDDFSMNQTLSLYLLDTLPKLDPESPDHALDVVTLVESILEDPDIILRKQLDRLKSKRLAEMKLEGLDYDQRMAELEKLEYPKPLRDFVYATFNEFSDRHPWVGQENIRPKSIAREMFEDFRSFSDYVRDYDLQRSEGLLLRHLNGVYKVLAQTVPEGAKTDEVREMELYLRTMLRQVDSSLMDEWEKMRDPGYRPVETQEAPPPKPERPDITRDRKAFTAAIRNRIFTFLRSLVMGEFEEAVTQLAEDAVAEERPWDGEGEAWTPERLKALMEAYRAEHGAPRLDPEGRNLRHTYVQPDEETKTWRVQQMLVDMDGANDWVAEYDVDLEASREEEQPVLDLRRLGPFHETTPC